MTSPAPVLAPAPPPSLASGERRTVVRAALLGGAVAAVAILGFSGGNVYKMTLSDGLISRYVAANFNVDPGDVHPVVSSRGTSLRYGRVGLSAVIWVFSAGRAPVMPYVQPVIMVLCAAAVSAAVATLFGRAPPAFLLAPFLALGYLLSVVGGFQDALAIALGLWAVVAAKRERWWPAAGLLAAALLTRENAGAVLVGIAAWCALRHRWREIAVLATALVPVAGWYAYVMARYGHLPPLDPYLRAETSTIRPPLLAVWQSLTRSAPDATLIVVIHVALAAVAFLMWKRSMLGAVAAAAGLQVLMAGPFAYEFIGEAVRAFTPLQVFLLLALLAVAHDRRVTRESP